MEDSNLRLGETLGTLAQDRGMSATKKSDPLYITVVAPGGDCRQAQVYTPSDGRQEHPRTAWCCLWCSWVCIAPTLDQAPPHTCLSNRDGVVRAF